jgi:hypothetical protein
MDIYSIRKHNLEKLSEGRKRKDCAEKWNTSASTLSQILSKNPVRNLGDELARRIEKAEGLPSGWLDSMQLDPFPGYEALNRVPFIPSSKLSSNMAELWAAQIEKKNKEKAIIDLVLSMVKEEADKRTPAWDLISAIVEASADGIVEDSEFIALTEIMLSRMEQNKKE